MTEGFVNIVDKRSLKILKGQSEGVNRKGQKTQWPKEKKKDKRTNIMVMNSGAPEGWEVSAPLGPTVVLFLLQTRWYAMNEEKTGLLLRQTNISVAIVT